MRVESHIKTIEMNNKLVKDKIGRLPGSLQTEVLDYIDFLLKKYKQKVKKEKFRFDWEGGLSELKDKYTSVELQHKALDLR